MGRLVHIWFISHLTPGPGCLFARMTNPREVPRQQQWCQFRVETHGPSKLWGDDGADAPDEGVAKVVGAIGSAGQRELAGKKVARVTVIVRAAGGPWGTQAEKLELDCDRDNGVTTHQRDQISGCSRVGRARQQRRRSGLVSARADTQPDAGLGTWPHCGGVRMRGMRLTRLVFGISVLLCAVGALGVARAVEHPSGANFWAGPYSPTRMEWLALKLNVEAGRRCDDQPDPRCIDINFTELVGSTGLGLMVHRGRNDEQVARAEIVRAIERVRMNFLGNAWSGNVPSITIMESDSKGGFSAWRCIPRQVTGGSSMLPSERYNTAQLADVCDSFTRAR